jgi:hypothetical protein
MLNIEKKGNITMKKTYIAPRAQVIVIGAVQMICESLGVKGSINGSEEGFQKAVKDRGEYEPVDEGSFGDLW